MAWITLVAAGLLEVTWAYAMKLSHGFTRPWPAGPTVPLAKGREGSQPCRPNTK